MLDEVDVLVRKSGLLTYVTPMGKGNINESLENFSGMYFGAFTDESTKEAVENSDLVLYIGPIKSDVNTAWFTTKLQQEQTIEFYNGHVEIGYAKYEGIQMKAVLQKLSARIPSSPPHSPKFEWASTTNNPTTAVSVHQMPEPILHEYLWKRLSSWFQPNDIIITENGTANIGIWDSKFPPGVQAINQTLWGSIGYSVGAAQGAALALKDARSESRTILFVGDGNLPISGYKLRSSR